jgi:hypothetical protein
MNDSNNPRGGIFGESATASVTPDIGAFATVGVSHWPLGTRSAMPLEPKSAPIGFSKVGMGAYPSATVARTVHSGPISMDPRAVMVNRLPKLGQAPKHVGYPGYTPKGGVLDGSSVDVGYAAGGRYFEEKEPHVIGSNSSARSLPNPQLALRNMQQRSLMPTPQMSGFAGPQATMPSRAISAAPRKMGESVFLGPVDRDNFPSQSLMPTMGPINGFGSGPDGLGGCGCSGWNSLGTTAGTVGPGGPRVDTPYVAPLPLPQLSPGTILTPEGEKDPQLAALMKLGPYLEVASKTGEFPSKSRSGSLLQYFPADVASAMTMGMYLEPVPGTKQARGASSFDVQLGPDDAKTRVDLGSYIKSGYAVLFAKKLGKDLFNVVLSKDPKEIFALASAGGSHLVLSIPADIEKVARPGGKPMDNRIFGIPMTFKTFALIGGGLVAGALVVRSIKR